MNLYIIKSLIEENKFSGGVRGLAEVVGMTEQNLHRCVRENKIQAGDLEKISKVLGVPISIFFNEDRIEEIGKMTISATDHSQAASRDLHIATSARESDLEKENQELRQQLIEAQSKIIRLMETQTK